MNCQAQVELAAARRHAKAMAKQTDHVAREERLAAKLRENLHRRKAQARDQAREPATPPPSEDATDTEPENDSDALSNRGAES